MPTAIRRTNAETLTIERISEILSLVVRDNGCWRYTGRRNPNGYAVVCIERRDTYLHRVTYALVNGEPTQILDHICSVRNCINPKHLRQVTPRENALYSKKTLAYLNLLKTECPQGHAYAGKNLYILPGKGYRGCRACRRDSIRRVRAALKDSN